MAFPYIVYNIGKKKQEIYIFAVENSTYRWCMPSTYMLYLLQKIKINTVTMYIITELLTSPVCC